MRYIIILIMLLLIGCAGRMPLTPPMPSDSSISSEVRTVKERNYVVGEPGSASVGQPIVRVKDYDVVATSSNVFKLPVELTARMRPFGPTRTFPVGTELKLVGSRTHEGAHLRAVVLPDRSFSLFPLLIEPSGRFSNLIHSVQHGYVFESSSKNIVEYLPLGFTLSQDVQEQVQRSGAFSNFELLYSGAGRDDFTLLYREYTADDLVRPAFSQNLVYDNGSEYVRFRDFRIRVISVDSERIVYVIEEDGA